MVPNGIPLDEFETAHSCGPAATAHDMVRLVFVSRFEPPKDHETFLRALTAVPNAHLFLVGDGRLRPKIETLARSLGIAERVIFLGRRNDVAGILKAWTYTSTPPALMPSESQPAKLWQQAYR